MFLNVSIKNYKNFKDKQTIYFTATKNRDGDFKDEVKLNENTFEINNDKFFKSIVIYGENGSGKTNITKALFFIKDFIMRPPLANMESGLVANEQFLKSFKLDESTINEPSFFEFEVLLNSIKYKYNFSANNNKIYSERLEQFNNETNEYNYIFDRDIDSKVNFNQNSSIANNIEKSFKSFFENAIIKTNSLFLSYVISIGGTKLGKDFEEFFKNKFFVFPTDSTNGLLTLNKLEKDQSNYKIKIINFLNAVDINIEDIKLDPINGKTINIDLTKNESFVKDTLFKKLTFERKNKQNNIVSFDISEESAGTKKMFDLSGDIINILENGLILFLDELDSRLHTELLLFIIELFNNPEINTKNAQLIFTAHNTSILNKKLDLFRRDQIYIINRKAFNESEIYSMAEFGKGASKSKSQESIINSGVIGGNPMVGRFDWKD